MQLVIPAKKVSRLAHMSGTRLAASERFSQCSGLMEDDRENRQETIVRLPRLVDIRFRKRNYVVLHCHPPREHNRGMET
jgi:hypothetical protein